MNPKASFYSDMVGSQGQAFWSAEVERDLLCIMACF